MRERREGSAWRGWFRGLSFGGRSPYGDPFTYEGWDGHLDLVRLELRDRQVVGHLLGAVDDWIGRYGIDGLRLDAADRLHAGETVAVRGGRLSMEIPARGARILISAP